MSSRSIYRDYAAEYARFSERSAPNRNYDHPAILHLAGDLQGKRVVELGCAAGVLTEELATRGADVLALDREPGLVKLARKRVGDRARVEVADLEQPWVAVADHSADVVVASLVLHYLPDWGTVLAEARRCLVPGGVLIFSIHHPITGWMLSSGADYHRTELITEDWDWGGQPVTAHLYRRPLSAVFAPLRDAGLVIDVVDEPLPEISAEMDPALAVVLSTQPIFLYVRAIRE